MRDKIPKKKAQKMLYILVNFILLFLAVTFAVLYFRANISTEKFKNKYEIVFEESEKYKQAFLNIKNNPDIALEKYKKLEKMLEAMKNRIHGYGNEYLLPIESIIDELGRKFAFTQAGRKFKESKDAIKAMVKNSQAAICQFEEIDHKTNAEEFILDAFIGKAEAIVSKARKDNYGKLRQELIDVYSLVNLNGLGFRTSIYKSFLEAWEKIREEKKLKKETEKALKEADKQEQAIKKALEIAYGKMAKASKEERTRFEQEISELKEKNKLLEDKKRSLSMAQMTKTGHVYIISNVGSFGENVFKIGLTRRLEPQDRIDELGGSSVPFEFDVHALIRSEDAPALENKLHKHFLLSQVNKMNHRKEFFRVPLLKIRKEVEKLGLEAVWTMEAEATQYRESLQKEKQLKENPKIRDQWISGQIKLEELDLKAGSEDEEDEEEV